ncbi:Diaminopropionate ammonia-lyase [compost metagenome]
MTVDEQDAIDAMRRLARPAFGDRAIVAGESGGVGLAGLIKALADQDIKQTLELGDGSRILLINTEGATDPVRYEELVGEPPASVLARAAEAKV